MFTACGIVIRVPVYRKTRTVPKVRIACASLVAVLWTLLLACPKIIAQLLLFQETEARSFENAKSHYSEVVQWSMLARAFVALVCTAWYSASLLSFLEKGKQHEASCGLPLGEKGRVSPMNVALLCTTLVFAGFNVFTCGEEIVAIGQQRRGDANFAVDCVLLLSQTTSTLLVCFVIFQHERMIRAAVVALADYADAEFCAARGFVVGPMDTW
ncbi:hypothetical protein MTO96_016591 [Rhipicephalus appendiculatus]